MMQPIAGPWDSPKLVTAKRVPKVLPDILLSILSAMFKESPNFAVQLLHGGVWRSLVAHLVWDQGVQGSNPCTPTKKTSELKKGQQQLFASDPFFMLFLGNLGE